MAQFGSGTGSYGTIGTGPNVVYFTNAIPLTTTVVSNVVSFVPMQVSYYIVCTNSEANFKAGERFSESQVIGAATYYAGINANSSVVPGITFTGTNVFILNAGGGTAMSLTARGSSTPVNVTATVNFNIVTRVSSQ